MPQHTRKIWWGDFAAPEFEGIDAEATIAVLPIAAIEQHGPHLPVATDSVIMQGMLDTAIAMLPDALDVRVLPIQAVGASAEHAYAAGTLSLSPSLLIETWRALAMSVARAGIRKLVFINSHGGNVEVMGLVTRELRVACAMMAVKTSWERFGQPARLFPEDELRLGIHGGALETSLMLHFRPDLVDMDQARDFPSAVTRAEEAFGLLRPTGAHAFAWQASDLNPDGVVGDAAAASAHKGRLAAEHGARGFVQLLQDVRNARLQSWLREDRAQAR